MPTPVLVPPLVGRAAGACLVALLLGALAPSAAGAQADPPQAYWVTIREAIAEAEAGRHAEALVLFRQAHELAPSARTLRGIGLMLYELEDYVPALVTLEEALSDPRRPLESGDATQVQASVNRLRALVGRVALRLEPAGAEVLVDGSRPIRTLEGELLVNPGHHQIEITADGYDSVVRDVELTPGAHIRLRIALVRPDVEPDPGPMVRLTVEGEREGLSLHAVPLLAAEAQGGMMARSTVCAAPCVQDLPPGRYALGVADGEHPPVSAGAFDLSEPSDVLINYNDRWVWRLLGLLTIPTSILASVGWALAAGYAAGNAGAILALVSVSIGTGILGIPLSLTWSLLNDSSEVRVSPRSLD